MPALFLPTKRNLSNTVITMILILEIIAIICIVYGVQIMLIGSGTWFFAVWFVLGIVFLGIAVALGLGWIETWPRIVRWALGGVGCTALALCIVTQGLAISCFGSQGEDDLDCIIVLGAQIRENSPSVVLRYRLDKAIEYLEENPKTHCIVSGGQGANEPRPEAQVMAEYLINRGIDSNRISIEDKSLNTVENILNSKAFIDVEHDRVGIVTNDFHIFRGTAIARKQGFAHVCSIAAPSNAWAIPNNLLRETFGISKDFLQSNL